MSFLNMIHPNPTPEDQSAGDRKRGRMVFVDFGKSRCYVVCEDSVRELSYEEFLAMLEDGVEAVVADCYPRSLLKSLMKIKLRFYRLRDSQLFPKIRKAYRAEKAHTTDALLLKKYFQQNPEDFVEEEFYLHSVIADYKRLEKVNHLLYEMRSEDNGDDNSGVIKNISKSMKMGARNARDYLKKHHPFWHAVAKELGLTWRHYSGWIGIAVIATINIDWSRPFRDLKAFAGLRGNDKDHCYNRKFRYGIMKVTQSLLRRQRVRKRDMRKILRQLQLTVQKAGKEPRTMCIRRPSLLEEC